MSKYVTRALPHYIFEVDAIEIWLEDTAKEGLELDSVSFGNANFKFKRVDDVPMRYRVRLVTEKAIASRTEIQELYKEAGWALISARSGWGKNLEVYGTRDESAVEPHTDPAVFEQSLSWVFNKFWKTAALHAGFVIYFLYTCVPDWGELFHRPFVSIVEAPRLELIPLALIFATVTVITQVQEYTALRRFRRRLQRGEVFSRVGAVKKRNPELASAIFVSVMVATVVLSIVSGGGGSGNPSFDTSSYQNEMQLPLLESINSSEWEELKKPNPQEEAAEGKDFYWTQRGIVVWKSLHIRQKGPSTEKEIVIENGWESTHYSGGFYYDIDHRKIGNTWLAEGYFSEFCDEWGLEPHLVTETDVAVAYDSSDGEQILTLQYRNQVLTIWYNGASNLLDSTDLYIASLKSEN